MSDIVFIGGSVITATSDLPEAEALAVRGPNGELTGEAQEYAAVVALTTPVMRASRGDEGSKVRWLCGQLSKAGITTVTEMAYDTRFKDSLEGVTAQPDFPVRMRGYQVGLPELAADADHQPGVPAPVEALFGQTGMKLWACGSPWIGNIATSFAYLDTPVTRSMGLEPHHRGGMNYTSEQIRELAFGFNRQGWQLACHVMGDVGVDVVLDAYEAALQDAPRKDHRLRLEHCSAMRPSNSSVPRDWA
jgi:predicted amidohydrolase YtcJ